MNISEFIGNYKNHPILFIGTGVSLRYLKNSYTWDGLLSRISFDLHGSLEPYLDIKSNCQIKGEYKYDMIASSLEAKFNSHLLSDRNGCFKEINDEFYRRMEQGDNISRFKIYISKILSDITHKDNINIELQELKKTRKNIGSIVTTNYDCFIESIFEFNPLLGNNILLSNPYGSIYKVHGCTSDPSKIIINTDDYYKFITSYELIRAQLLSLFIHNPIIFLGYSIGDENIKQILKTIFTYIEPNSVEATKIKNNFLLVEYCKDSTSQEILDHHIDIEGFSMVSINKIKTDDYVSIYQCLSNLKLPISAMDVRKVQDIVKEIYAGGQIKVNITEDLDSMQNSEKIIAIGSVKTISYQYHTHAEMMANYFKIIDESNDQILMLINKYKISKSQYFPCFGFSTICSGIENIELLKTQQQTKISEFIASLSEKCRSTHSSIILVQQDESISKSNKINAIACGINNDCISLSEAEDYLRQYQSKNTTDYRKILCIYDFKKYGTIVNNTQA
jgi:hypothetical protein